MGFLKFYVAKRDKSNCYACGSQILEGEEFCVMFLSKVLSNGIIWKRKLLFHAIDCYQRWLDESYVKQLLKWRENRDAPEPRPIRPKRGRPITNTEPTREEQINRLKTLLNYHRKIGGRDRKVKRLQERIDKL